VPNAEQHYRDDAGRQYHGVKRALPAEALQWVARLRAETFRPVVRPTDTVLEFGVGAGWNLRELPCARKIGCDVATFLETDLRSAGIEFHPSIEELPDALADVLICHHALEHVLEPAKVLVELRRLLKPGGALLLHVPLETRRRYRRFNPEEPNHHLYSWNVQTLGALVTECGWRVESGGAGRFGYDRFAGVLAKRMKLGEAGFRLLRRLLHLIRPEREVRIVARLGRPGAGLSDEVSAV
jgi:SAM-dependent methyltransferase